ncbi:MAG: DUF58 domain-containing protein [Burkholderiaceae bacterium]|nr:DUF58 domain-containing protein [Burkholderiaceae bacterium]
MAALLQRLTGAVQRRWRSYLGGAAARSMTLSLRRIYIVPSYTGLQCALLLLVMLVGALNYNLGLGYALTFLLASCMLADMVATARNLAGLQLLPQATTPVFAGETAFFPIQLTPAARRQHYAIWLGFQGDGAPRQHCDVGTTGSTSLRLSAATTTRGWQPAARIRLVTRFPLGLFRAWSYWQPVQQVLVYPAPESPAAPLPQQSSDGDGPSRHDSAGQEHYAGVRNYQPGDSPRQLAWRQIARHAASDTAPLLSKHLSGGAAGWLVFDLAALPAELSLDQQLARLCAWVLAAEAAALPYRLRLGDLDIGPDSDDGKHAEHRQQAACLRALALYGKEPAL